MSSAPSFPAPRSTQPGRASLCQRRGRREVVAAIAPTLNGEFYLVTNLDLSDVDGVEPGAVDPGTRVLRGPAHQLQTAPVLADTGHPGDDDLRLPAAPLT